MTTACAHSGKRLAYQDRLAAFAAQATTWTQPMQGIKPAHCASCSPDDRRSRHMVCGWSRRGIHIPDGRWAACECCGNKRLKTRYPIVPDGDVSRVKMVGVECLKNLEEMGKIADTECYLVEV